MTKSLIDIRERTHAMIRALNVEIDYSNERVIEKYVRWIDEKMIEYYYSDFSTRWVSCKVVP